MIPYSCSRTRPRRNIPCFLPARASKGTAPAATHWLSGVILRYRKNLQASHWTPSSPYFALAQTRCLGAGRSSVWSGSGPGGATKSRTERLATSSRWERGAACLVVRNNNCFEYVTTRNTLRFTTSWCATPSRATRPEATFTQNPMGIPPFCTVDSIYLEYTFMILSRSGKNLLEASGFVKKSARL